MRAIRSACGLLASLLVLTIPRGAASQTPPYALNGVGAALNALPGSTLIGEGPWEATFTTRIGFPAGGTLQSVDRPVPANLVRRELPPLGLRTIHNAYA